MGVMKMTWLQHTINGTVCQVIQTKYFILCLWFHFIKKAPKKIHIDEDNKIQPLTSSNSIIIIINGFYFPYPIIA